MRVLALSHGVAELLEQGDRRGDRRALPLDRREVVAAHRPSHHVLDERNGAGRELAERLATVMIDEVRGVQALGQDQDDRLHREAFDELEGAFGRARPRVVRVEREHHPLREPGRESEVSFAERGPTRRHRVRDAGVDHRDHVGVALDEEELPRSGGRGLRALQVVQDLGLSVHGSLGRVQILRTVLATAGQDPSADPDRLPGQVVDRERDPPAEPVADVALLILQGEARLDEQLRRERLDEPAEQEVRVPRRVPDLELGRHLTVDAAGLEVGAGLLPFLGFQERPVVQLERGLVRADQRLALGRHAPFGGRVALVAERDPRVLGETFDRLGELEVFDIAQEPDRVPALAAAEAVVEALRGRDAERRRLLRVERTEPDEPVVARLLEREVAGDELDDVGALADGRDVLVPDPAGHALSPRPSRYSNQRWGRNSCS